MMPDILTLTEILLTEDKIRSKFLIVEDQNKNLLKQSLHIVN